MEKVEGKLCLPQDDHGGTRHMFKRKIEQGQEVLEGEEISSTSSTDLQLMSPQRNVSGSLRNNPEEFIKSPFYYIRCLDFTGPINIDKRIFYKTFSGCPKNISEEQREFLSNCFSCFKITGFSPHTKRIIIKDTLLVGVFDKLNCFIFDLELDKRQAEPRFIHIIINVLKMDPQHGDHPYVLEKDDNPQNIPNMLFYLDRQLPNLNNINSNKREKFLELIKKRENNESAIAGVFKNDRCIHTFPSVTPDHKSKPKRHCEELLIQKIDSYLVKMVQKPNNKKQKIEILIYLPNSPCFKREKETIVPCFFLLSKTAERWQKEYNCHTDVGFTDYWGPLTPHVLREYPKSKILSDSSAFFLCIEKSNNVCVTLEGENICKKIKLNRNKKLKDKKNEKKNQKVPNLNIDIRKCLEELENLAKSELKFLDHQIIGKEIITSSKFDSSVKDEICAIWGEEVENQRLEFIKKEFIADLNKKIAILFLNYQSYSSRNEFLQLCLIERQDLPTNI